MSINAHFPITEIEIETISHVLMTIPILRYRLKSFVEVSNNSLTLLFDLFTTWADRVLRG